MRALLARRSTAGLTEATPEQLDSPTQERRPQGATDDARPPFDPPTRAPTSASSPPSSAVPRAASSASPRAACAATRRWSRPRPRLDDGTPFPTLYYLSAPGGDGRDVDPRGDRGDGRARRDCSSARPPSAYQRAHGATSPTARASRSCPRSSGFSAGGMPNRVKCLHALAGHALAAGPGVEPDRRRRARALELVARRAASAPTTASTCPNRRSPPTMNRRPARAGLDVVLLAALAPVAAAVAAAAPSRSPAPARARRRRARPRVLARRLRHRRRRGRHARRGRHDRHHRHRRRRRGARAARAPSSAARTSRGLGSAERPDAGRLDGPEHGTMVASLAAGRGTGAGAGVIGVAPGGVACSRSRSVSATGVDSDDQIAEAVRWAVDNGADVINMSLTRNTLDWPESWDDAFLYAMEHDVVIVAAAGNRGSGTIEVGAPATMPGVLTVAGVDENGNASWDASRTGHHDRRSRRRARDLVGVVPGGGLRDLERHERRRRRSWPGSSRSCARASGARRRERHQTRHRDGRPTRARRCRAPLTASGWSMPLAAVTAEVADGDREPDGRPRGLDPPAPSRGCRRPTPTDDGAPGDRARSPTRRCPDRHGAQTLLPTAWTLACITVPLSLVAGFGTLAALFGIGATRHSRRTVRTREQ